MDENYVKPKDQSSNKGRGAENRNPNLVYVHVAIAPPNGGKDRYFILTKAQLQKVCIKGYSAWMDKKGWRRPRKPDSYMCRYWIEEVEHYENNWRLITRKLQL